MQQSRFMRAIKIILTLILFNISVVYAQHDKILSWGDQGNGTYNNPIINGDYSDPDVIRVGSDYYLITSTFHLSPGITVLHSKDLINWKIIGHAITDIASFDSEYSADKMGEYGHGVWAPALRYHDGKYWVYVFDPVFGLFMTTATNPAGPWAPAHQVFKAKNYDDCCPFWDDDGQMYLSCANFDRGWPNDYDVKLFKLSTDGKNLQDSGTIIHKGPVAEATKMYKINGWYYILYCQDFKDTHRAQMAMRSKNIYGPYEHKRLCQERGIQSKDFGNNAAQGGLVQTEKGDWYFLHHWAVMSNPMGRTLAMAPVRWIEGWPIIGKVEADGVGSMVLEGKKPINNYPVVRPQTNDEFNSNTLGLMWEWNHSPRNDKWSLTERKGYLRLYASQPLQKDNFFKASNTLLQRVMGSEYGNITTYIDISRMQNGQTTGLCIVSNNLGLLKIVQRENKRFIQTYINSEKQDGKLIPTNKVWLKAISKDNVYQFYYSFDGKIFEQVGAKFELKDWCNWRGVEFGLFCWNDETATGSVDVDWFRYDFR
jgi:beta-xylosidase